MICAPCRAQHRSPRGTSHPGYCEACGWALRLDGDRETPDLVTVHPSAALLVARASVFDDWNKGRASGHVEFGPTGAPAFTDEGREEILRRALVPVIESRKPQP